MTAPSTLPRLQEWPAMWGESRPRRNTGMLWLGIALFALTASAVAARSPFVKGRARLIDAASLTRGSVGTPDVRVHLVSERRPGAVMLMLSVVWALVLTTATVVAIGIGVSGRPEAFLGVAVLAAAAALFVYAAVRAAITQYRANSFGRRPLGVGIGAHGVTLLRATETLYLPWSALRRVEADLTEPRRGMDQLPLIRLRVDPARVRASGGMRVPATVTVAPAMLRAHPQLVWSALRGFHDSPSARAVLGAPAGERLLHEWAASAPSD